MKIDLSQPSRQEQYRRILNYGALPKYTTTERDNIKDPIDGQSIYNTTTNKINFYNGTSWEVVASS